MYRRYRETKWAWYNTWPEPGEPPPWPYRGFWDWLWRSIVKG